MGNTEEIKKGDKLYRFAFNLGTGTIDKTVFTVIGTEIYLLKLKHTDDGKDVYTYFDKYNVDVKVTTRSTSKYVTLSEDDFGKAMEMVHEQLRCRVDTLSKQLEVAEANLDKLEQMGDIR